MSHVIGADCVDVLDRSCVEVCPVDCIYVGERLPRLRRLRPAGSSSASALATARWSPSGCDPAPRSTCGTGSTRSGAYSPATRSAVSGCVTRTPSRSTWPPPVPATCGTPGVGGHRRAEAHRRPRGAGLVRTREVLPAQRRATGSGRGLALPADGGGGPVGRAGQGRAAADGHPRRPAHDLSTAGSWSRSTGPTSPTRSTARSRRRPGCGLRSGSIMAGGFPAASGSAGRAASSPVSSSQSSACLSCPMSRTRG
jgi:NAD-dependent dihydropyrimidine dehydrogenase PreA subunit